MQARSTGMCGPSATTRRKARRASQPNAGARHRCLRAWMTELVPARIRREAQGTGEAGAEPACARRKAFSALFRPEKGLAGRRPVKASLYRSRQKHRSEEHTSELQSIMRSSSAVFCLKKKK